MRPGQAGHARAQSNLAACLLLGPPGVQRDLGKHQHIQHILLYGRRVLYQPSKPGQ
jgi:hypothetical protein